MEKVVVKIGEITQPMCELLESEGLTTKGVQ